MENVGIKETKEALAAVELIAVQAVKIADNGLSLKEDLPHVIDLAKNAGVLVDGFKDIGDVKKEAKDLDQAELLELGTIAFNMIKNIKKAKEEAKASRKS